MKARSLRWLGACALLIISPLPQSWGASPHEQLRGDGQREGLGQQKRQPPASLSVSILVDATANRRAIFPGLELTATTPFDAGDGDSVKWTVLPQVRVGLTRGGHVALNAGVELPLSDQTYETRYHLVLLWDFADGSFFKGW